MKKILNKSLYIVIAIVFLWIFCFSFVFPSNVYYTQNSFISFIFAIIILGLWFLLYKFINCHIKNISIKHEIIFGFVFFILVTIIQITVIKYLSVDPGWDFGVVYDNAYQFALTGSRNNAIYIEYFQYFPNNIFLFIILIVFIKLGLFIGITAIQAAVIMNIIFIDAALFILYLVLRKKINTKNAIFGMIITLFFLPIFLYTPIFYSDTLTMFVGILFIYLFTFIDKDRLSLKNILLFIIIGLLVFIGKSLKITSIIVFIALLLDLFLNNKFKYSCIYLGISIITTAIMILLFNIVVVNNSRFAFQQNNYGSYPYTHWLMMGVEDIDKDNSARNSYGGYNLEDYNYTKSFETGKSAMPANIEEYRNRVEKLGIGGYLIYLTKKAVNTWSDGYYFSDVALSINPTNNNSYLRNILFNNLPSKYFFIYFTQGVQFCFILCLIFGCLIKLKMKISQIDYIRFAIFGLMIFLLLWENRSRYLVNFIPLFIYVIVEFYYLVYNYYLKRKN